MSAMSVGFVPADVRQLHGQLVSKGKRGLSTGGARHRTGTPGNSRGRCVAVTPGSRPAPGRGLVNKRDRYAAHQIARVPPRPHKDTPFE